ncbi:hypothetical protein CTAYLR_010122 [Chrysophaeum taylorii]|uniref:DNA ligase n=1 Tax=Chrysophaeum taylorii TaxID=2483200 RepID=A0AAD7UH25_9STRA|nr:hypothetical protein CTAYLR_010122 [Chrysophaeum taylorii]
MDASSHHRGQRHRSKRSSQEQANQPAQVAVAPGPEAPLSSRWEAANAVPFAELCARLERVDAAKGTRQKLAALFGQPDWLPRKSTLFPVVRLLLPGEEKHRPKYGLQAKSLAKLYKQGVHADKEDEAKLEYHLGHQRKKHVDDLDRVIEGILQKRTTETASSLTIGGANEYLDELATAKTPSPVFNEYLYKFAPREHKWLVRIICGDLNCGIRATAILNHLDARGMVHYENTLDLKRVCDDLAAGKTLARRVDLRPGHPFRPMVAMGFPNEVDQVAKVDKVLGRPYVADEKLDGERMLVHKAASNEITLWTRSAMDYTDDYRRMIGPDIEAWLGPQTAILDGEIVAVDTDHCLPFGGNQAVRLVESGKATEPPEGWTKEQVNRAKLRYVVFDILLLDNEPLDQRPLSERRARLLALYDSYAPTDASSFRRIEIVRHRMLDMVASEDRRSNLKSFFEDVVEKGGEGVIVKALDSTYHFGDASRNLKHWLKMKPDYANSATLDLLVIGGYWSDATGSHKRKGKISHFLLAALVDDGRLATVGKVGSGFNIAQLDELNRGDNWKEFCDRAPEPEWLVGGYKMHKKEDRPEFVAKDVEKATVLEVRAGGVVRSNQFSSTFTLRFPRNVSVRRDKAWDQIATVEEVSQFTAAKTSEAAANSTEAKKKKKKRKLQQFGADFDPHKLRKLDRVTSIFDGMRFVLLSGVKDREKFRESLAKNGAKFLISSNADDVAYIGAPGRDVNQVATARSVDKDVYDSRWFLKCIQAGKLLEKTPRDFVAPSTANTKKLRENYEPLLGTPYATTVTDISSFVKDAKAMRKMSQFYASPTPATDEEAKDYLRSQLKKRHFKYFILDSFKFLLAPTTKAFAPRLRCFGAKTTEDETQPGITHVLVNQREAPQLQAPPNVKIVTPAWLDTTLRY